MAEAKVSSEEKNVVVCPANYTQAAYAIDRVRQNERMFKELLNVENCNQYPTMLKDCTEVHVGPRIEIYCEEPNASCVKKDEERNEMFDNCCQKMKEKYVTYFSYMRSFLWEGKRNDFPLKDYFVELTVEKTDIFGNKSGKKISLNEIFAIKQDGHQTILVTGDPGYGKSTLCKKIAYDWASTDYLRHFELTFLVILRELGDKSVTDALVDNILELTDKNWTLQDKNLNVLVILDGFDEIVDKSKIIKFIRKESFDISRTMTILITSRPQAAEEIREDMKMRIVIKGFSPEYKKKYIQLMFREDEIKANELISVLTINEFYGEIAECPLMLHMLCCLHRNGEMEKLETMADLYIRIFTLITERYVRKTNQKRKFKRGKYFVGENLLMKLTRLKLYILYITSEDLEDLFPNEDERNFITGLDILTLDSFSECDNIIRYSFVHRTFGEFLTALSIYFGCIKFPCVTFYDELLFLIGLYKDDPLPKTFLTYIEKKMCTPDFIFRAHKQIKLKTNWEQFCSHTKVKIVHWEVLIFSKELFNLYEFKELYLFFEQTKGEYEVMNLPAGLFWKFFSVCSNFKIYLVLLLQGEFSNNLYDIRKPVSHIIDFIRLMKAINVDIYFVGVKCYKDLDFGRFTKVQYNLNLSEIRKSLNINEYEKLIALETVNNFKKSNSFILSLEQYETLHDRIVFQSANKQNLKCAVM
ncbi:NACHT, LRR and PYD domains-containing protein 12-like [Centruroides vittatus]|uniref:NACHT, LRR and PYD domains-containing protein 12-like n=1 Tax=Centruroides vittatus TaxID=120091 RepID=UPI00350EE9A3